MTFSLATKADLHLVHTLYMDPSTNPFLAYDLMSEDAFAPVYDELLATGSLYLVADAGHTVGSFHITPKKYRQSDTVYLATLVIAPGARGKGYAEKILRKIIEMLRAAKKNRVELEVSVNNEPAIALYHKMGFVMEGRIRQSYKIGTEGIYYDDYLMSLLLHESTDKK